MLVGSVCSGSVVKCKQMIVVIESTLRNVYRCVDVMLSNRVFFSSRVSNSIVKNLARGLENSRRFRASLVSVTLFFGHNLHYVVR